MLFQPQQPKQPPTTSHNHADKRKAYFEGISNIFTSINTHMGALRAFAEDMRRLTVTEVQASVVRLKRLLENLDQETLELRTLVEEAVVHSSSTSITNNNNNTNSTIPPTFSSLKNQTNSVVKANEQITTTSMQIEDSRFREEAIQLLHELMICAKDVCNSDVAYILLPETENSELTSSNYVSIPNDPEPPQNVLVSVGRAVDIHRNGVNITDNTAGAIFQAVLAVPLKLPQKSFRRHGVVLVGLKSGGGQLNSTRAFTPLEEGKLSIIADVATALVRYGGLTGVSIHT
eukprot:PhF_6_TR26418/c0_g1_i2/m.38214